MDSQASVEGILKIRAGWDPSRESPKKLHQVHDCGRCKADAKKTAGSGVELPQTLGLAATDETASSLGPITPDCDKEKGDFLKDCKSPLTVIYSPSSMSVHSPRTPNEVVFDPFAPGPDEMALAPLGKKYSGQSRFSVSRRLRFDSSSLDGDENCRDGTEPCHDEEKLLESVYETILEVIVSKQEEGVLATLSELKADCQGLRTPTSAPLLSGVAETCPGAPMKASGKRRDIDLSLCRKLEF